MLWRQKIRRKSNLLPPEPEKEGREWEELRLNKGQSMGLSCWVLGGRRVWQLLLRVRMRVAIKISTIIWKIPIWLQRIIIFRDNFKKRRREVELPKVGFHPNNKKYWWTQLANFWPSTIYVKMPITQAYQDFVVILN